MKLSSFRTSRRAAAVVELAILLPLLVFLIVVAVDFARVYKDTLTLTNCARSGALYGTESPARYLDDAKITAAALADANDLTPTPTVSIRRFTDTFGDKHLEVTTTWTFNTITNYPGIPSTITLRRSVQMRCVAGSPKATATSTP
jgi:Flp pilus assembly protein TadG